MKEIKYLSHILRNVLIYLIFIFFAYTYGAASLPLDTIVIGLLAYVFAYTPVYFINDFADHREDKQYGKANLFLSFKSPAIYWDVFALLGLIGISLTAVLSPLALLFLVLLYLLNILYSVKPPRLREVAYMRELSMLLIYTTKVYYFSQLLFGVPLVLPLLVALFIGATGAISLSIYKRYYRKNKVSEIIFGLLFVLLWMLVIVTQPQIRYYFLPMVPTVGLLAWLYKDKQIPIGLIQGLYFLYVLGVFWVTH